MATFKCEIKKQFGKFSGHVWNASGRPDKATCENEATVAAAADKVLTALGKSGFGEGDEVIFRDNAYPSIGELKAALLRAPY